MSLRDDITEALTASMGDWFEGDGEKQYICVDLIVNTVWGVLEDKLGTVQEKLMVDRDHARTERDQAVARAGALAETVAQQAAMIEHLRSQVGQS